MKHAIQHLQLLEASDWMTTFLTAAALGGSCWRPDNRACLFDRRNKEKSLMRVMRDVLLDFIIPLVVHAVVGVVLSGHLNVLGRHDGASSHLRQYKQGSQ